MSLDVLTNVTGSIYFTVLLTVIAFIATRAWVLPLMKILSEIKLKYKEIKRRRR